LLAAVTATEKAAAEAALLAAVHDDEENGRFVEDDEAGVADEAAESATDGAAEARLVAVLDDEAHGRFVADEETGMADDAADAITNLGGAVGSDDGASIDDEEDVDIADDEADLDCAVTVADVTKDGHGNLLTGTAVEGGEDFSVDCFAGNWVAVGEVPVIPDVNSTNQSSDGSLVFVPPCATCLRSAPDYPGPRSVTNIRIGQFSRHMFDHHVRRTYIDPQGSRRTITFYRIRHWHDELDGNWLHDFNPNQSDKSTVWVK
jgi:hypothetical protein